MSFLNDLFTFGPTCTEADAVRLTTQKEQIRAYLLTGPYFYTLAEISAYTGFPEASISAQLRHIKHEKIGLHTYEKRRRNGGHGGTWEYKLTNRLDTTAEGV